MIDAGRIDKVAELIYRESANSPYQGRWALCGPKMRWRKAAEAVLTAIEKGLI